MQNPDWNQTNREPVDRPPEKSAGDSPKPRISFFRSWLKPPVFPGEDEKTRLGRVLFTVIWVLLVVTLVAYLSLLASFALVRVVALIGLTIVELTALALLRRGQVRASALFLSASSWLILTIALIFTGGIDGSATPVQTLVVLTAGLLLGASAGVIFAILSVLAGFLMMLAEMNGLLPEPMVTLTISTYWLFSGLTFLASAGLIGITSRTLGETAERARRNEQAQIEANRQLQALSADLESQVNERTLALEKRSRYLQAGIEISRAAASILDIDHLLQQSVDLIGEQFDLYYVGLFMVEEEQTLEQEAPWAVLKAGTGQAGQALIARNHRIRVGSGMIGWAIANAAPRVALMAEQDAQRLTTPELPETRSEAAIPLRSRSKIIGAISVQSSQPNAFGEIELTSFQAMADQVALAIDNARLYQESQRAIQEVQRAYGVASRLAWRELIKSSNSSSGQMAYRFKDGRVAPVWLSLDALSDEQTAPASSESLELPITVREQTIGHLKIKKVASAGAWTPAEIDLLKGINEQVATAMESARLYQESQRLAMREQLTSEVTSRIRESLDIEQVLKNAAEEIRNVLGAPEVIIGVSGQPFSERSTVAHPSIANDGNGNSANQEIIA
jgi:GAF domain-containing protein